MEQYEVFGRVIAPGHTRADAEAARVWVGERAFERSGQLGSFAEDATFMWAWAKSDMRGLPGVEISARLRDIGIRHQVPEFTESIVDLNHFEDPWLAADQLALMAVAALKARGLTRFNHGGRAYTYLIVDDASVPEATGGEGARKYDGPAAEILAGTAPRVVNTGWTVAPGSPQGFFPDALLPVLASGLAVAIGTTGNLLDAVPELAELPRRTPVWDSASRLFHYAEQPELTFTAMEIGHYDARSQQWEWSDSGFEGSTAVRAAAVEHGADHLAAQQVSLASAPREMNAAHTLSAAAAHRGNARCWLQVPTPTGYTSLALTDPRIPLTGTDPDHACSLLDHAANLLHPLTRPSNRYPAMRALVTGFLEHHGVAMLYIGEPYFTGALFGLYELRAEFGSEGGLIRMHYDLMGTLSSAMP